MGRFVQRVSLRVSLRLCARGTDASLRLRSSRVRRSKDPGASAGGEDPSAVRGDVFAAGDDVRPVRGDVVSLRVRMLLVIDHLLSGDKMLYERIEGGH